jgi:hypothetical protein
MNNSKIKLVKIKQDLPTNDLGYVLRDVSKYENAFHGYKPGESFWAFDSDAEFENSWYVLKPHNPTQREFYIPGAIDKSHTEEVGWFKTIVALVKLGRNGAAVLGSRADAFERRNKARKAELAERLANRPKLLADSMEKYEDAMKSVENDERTGRISR